MSLLNVTLVGATGNVGSGVLPELLKSNFNITVLSREGSSAVFPEGVKVVKTDYSISSLTKALTGQDAVVSMLPIVALAEQQKVAEAALAAGVKRFIPSEFGSDTANDAVIAAVPFFQPKRSALDWLKTKQDQMSWTGIITGPFFDWGMRIGMVGIDLNKKTATLIDGGKNPFTTSNVTQIGRSIVAVLENLSDTANKLVYVQSFTTTQVDVLAEIEKITGEHYEVTEQSSSSIREKGFKLLEDGDLVGGGTAVIMALVFGNGSLEDHTHVDGGIWNKRLGLENEDLHNEVRNLILGN